MDLEWVSWFSLACWARCPSVPIKSNTHHRRDETVELRRVSGVNTPIGSRDPVYNFLC